MKICYVIESMYNSGGMERVLSVCANALTKYHEISILTLCQKGQECFFQLCKDIKHHDLGLTDVKNKSNLKEHLSKFFMCHHFDVVVSLGGLDLYYLHSIKDDSKKIVWLHFAWNRFIKSGNNFQNKIKGCLQTIKYINEIKKYHHVVVLTNHDAKVYKRLGINTSTIYNPCTINPTGISDLQTKRVISVGRLDYQKGYDYLIKAWKIIEQNHPDWELDIFGDGPKRNELNQLIQDLKVKHVFLRGTSTNLSDEYRSSSIYVMSSRYEGLGLVLLEASSCGLPLISYDCPYGPSDIIEDGKNGILIEKVGDIEGLVGAINKLIETPTLRIHMGYNAIRMIDQFLLPNITKQWIELFNEIVANN